MLGFSTLLAFSAAAFMASESSAIPTISIKGSKFFADGKQFFLKGVAYQGTPDDPLINVEQCRQDAKLMKSIGCNSIRVYHVDSRANHKGCMKVFADAGIYVWLDLESFFTSIQQNVPLWNEDYFISYKLVVDAFHQYNNVAGFWIGNEIIDTKNGSMAAPYLKAAAADMKSYITARKYRKIPVGYAAADIAELRPMIQNYLVCGPNPDERIDFFGLNSYEWCGQASYDSSGYVWLQEMTKDYPVPIFFSETGCNVGGERTFHDQAAIFGPEMSKTWSGAIVYEWVQEINHYGLVDYPNQKIFSGEPIKIQPDFNNLATQWKVASVVGVEERHYRPKTIIPVCPSTVNGWLVNGGVSLPRLNKHLVHGISHAGTTACKNTMTAAGEVSPRAAGELLSSSTPLVLVPTSLIIPFVPPTKPTSGYSPNSTSSESIASRNNYTTAPSIATSFVLMVAISIASLVVIIFL